MFYIHYSSGEVSIESFPPANKYDGLFKKSTEDGADYGKGSPMGFKTRAEAEEYIPVCKRALALQPSK